VTLAWSGAVSTTATCTANTAGVCTFRTGRLDAEQTSVTATVTSVAVPLRTYDAPANHDKSGAATSQVTLLRP
jgi:hypothetical protein